MRNLLYKEYRLAAHPTLYIFIIMGMMTMIPNYPYCTIFVYGCLAPFITLQNGKENNDAFYTSFLPVPKKSTVTAKYLLFITAELAQLLISIPFAYIGNLFVTGGFQVGIEANTAFYGFGLMIFTVFNMVFFNVFYKTAYKVGKAFIWAIIPASLLIIGVTGVAYIPSLSWLGFNNPSALAAQLPVLLAGILFFIFGNLWALRRAQKNFEKVDL